MRAIFMLLIIIVILKIMSKNKEKKPTMPSPILPSPESDVYNIENSEFFFYDL